MALLQMLIQVVTDWTRGILIDVAGRHAEHVVEMWLKKWRLRNGKKSRGNEREDLRGNKGE